MAAQQKRALCLMTGCEGLLIEECCQSGANQVNNLNEHPNLL